MNENALINRVRSYTTGTPGRSINNVRGHHFVIDEPRYAGGPEEEITPADAFLSGVSACGVLLVEAFARKQSIPFQRAEAVIEGIRDASDMSRFQRINIHFTIAGPSQRQAEELVERYKGK